MCIITRYGTDIAETKNEFDPVLFQVNFEKNVIFCDCKCLYIKRILQKAFEEF